ncbi:MAG: hypothetical protein ACHREM_12710 [Polyangiales bacterium]
MKRFNIAVSVALAIVSTSIGCGKSGSSSAPAPGDVTSVPVSQIPGHDGVAQDNSLKNGPRLLPAETFIRSYLSIFGGLAPLALQATLKGTDNANLFDTWKDYLAALGMPQYMNEIPRSSQTNALMIATFERAGVALCDRAVQADLASATAPTADKRLVFAFDLPTTGDVDDAAFAADFDVLHRTFLGMPASLAPTDRTAKFLALYRQTVTAHSAKGAQKSAFTPQQAGWATVCYGLVRHPEFHLY